MAVLMMFTAYLAFGVIPDLKGNQKIYYEYEPLACPENNCPECKPIEAICIKSDGSEDGCDPWEECWYKS